MGPDQDGNIVFPRRGSGEALRSLNNSSVSASIKERVIDAGPTGGSTSFEREKDKVECSIIKSESSGINFLVVAEAVPFDDER